jgi:hypothetical protein
MLLGGKAESMLAFVVQVEGFPPLEQRRVESLKHVVCDRLREKFTVEELSVHDGRPGPFPEEFQRASVVVVVGHTCVVSRALESVFAATPTSCGAVIVLGCQSMSGKRGYALLSAHSRGAGGPVLVGFSRAVKRSEVETTVAFSVLGIAPAEDEGGGGLSEKCEGGDSRGIRGAVQRLHSNAKAATGSGSGDPTVFLNVFNCPSTFASVLALVDKCSPQRDPGARLVAESWWDAFEEHIGSIVRFHLWTVDSDIGGSSSSCPKVADVLAHVDKGDLCSAAAEAKRVYDYFQLGSLEVVRGQVERGEVCSEWRELIATGKAFEDITGRTWDRRACLQIALAAFSGYHLLTAAQLYTLLAFVMVSCEDAQTFHFVAYAYMAVSSPASADPASPPLDLNMCLFRGDKGSYRLFVHTSITSMTLSTVSVRWDDSDPESRVVCQCGTRARVPLADCLKEPIGKLFSMPVNTFSL